MTSHLIVDRMRLSEEAKGHRYKLDADQEARTLGTYGRVLGAEGNMVAIVDEDDKDGINAYTRAGFTVHPMNGNRPAALTDFVTTMSLRLSQNRPSSLTICTNDRIFHTLANTVGEKAPPQTVTIWGWGSNLRDLWSPYYTTRRLEDILPGAKVPHIALLFDWENVVASLAQRGWKGSVKDLVRGIVELLETSGDVVLKRAYADFGVLSNQTRRDTQRELAEAGVEPVYVYSERGKNSADLVLTNAARDLLENQNGDTIDTLALVTHDRDFRSLIETTRQRGRQVKLLAFREGVSRHLINAVPERDILYLDDILHPPKRPPTQDTPPNPEWPRLSCNQSYATVVARIAAWLSQQGERGWHFAPTDELLAALAPAEADLAQVNKAVSAGVLRCGHRNGPDGYRETLGFNLQNPLAQAIHEVVPWARGLVDHSLNHLHMAYVDSNLIAMRMQKNRKLAALGVGQSRPEAERWLRLLADAEVIVPKLQERPGSQSKLITTWWLPTTEAPVAAAPPVESHAEPPAVDQAPPAGPATPAPAAPAAEPARPQDKDKRRWPNLDILTARTQNGMLVPVGAGAD